MSLQYIRWFPGDYLRDTLDLSLIEHGAYRLLLDHYYMHGSIPSEPDKLYRIVKAISDDEKISVISVSKRFFYENGNGTLYNKRADKELQISKDYSERQREKGRLSAKVRWEK